MSFRRLHPDVERKCLELADERPPIAATLTEKQFQSLVMGELRREGFITYHVHDSRKTTAGFPDVIAINTGRRLLLAPELKVRDNQPTAAQLTWIEAFQSVEKVWSGVWRPEMWPSIQATLRGE